jgi:hypothetical protein
MTEVRELLESAAEAVPDDTAAPLGAVVAAGRRRVRGRRLAIAGAGVATVAAVLAVGLPMRHASDGRLTGSVDMMTGSDANHAGPAPVAELPCGLDRAKLPGRTVTVDNGDWPTEQAADLLGLYGWPRAVPYSLARWTVVTDGSTGVLIAWLPGATPRYLTIHRGPNNSWVAGSPCAVR